MRLAVVLVARAAKDGISAFSLSHTLGGSGGVLGHCRLSVSVSSVRSRVRSSSQGRADRKVRKRSSKFATVPTNEITETARTWHGRCLRHQAAWQQGWNQFTRIPSDLILQVHPTICTNVSFTFPYTNMHPRRLAISTPS